MTAPLRPCGTCRTPVPAGQCPRHPSTARQYRPHRPSHVVYRDPTYKTNRRLTLAAHPTCQYCQQAPATTADHITPTSQGGSSHLSNLAAACHHCNTSKKDRTLNEWINTGQAPEGAKTLAAQRQEDGLPC